MHLTILTGIEAKDFPSKDLLFLSGNSDFYKVDNIQKDSMDSIPSPSVKIQIIGGKGYLR